MFQPGRGACGSVSIAGNAVGACAADTNVIVKGDSLCPAGRVLVQVDPATSALRGINVPTYVQFLEDGTDPSNANDFFYDLLEHPEDVLPPVEYGLVNATLAQFSLVQANPSVYTGVKRALLCATVEGHLLLGWANTYLLMQCSSCSSSFKCSYGCTWQLQAASASACLVETDRGEKSVPSICAAPYEHKKPRTAAIVGGVVGGLLGTAALVGIAVVLTRTGTGAHMLGSLPGAITKLPGTIHLPAMMRLPVGWQRADFEEGPQAPSKVSLLCLRRTPSNTCLRSEQVAGKAVHCCRRRLVLWPLCLPRWHLRCSGRTSAAVM